LLSFLFSDLALFLHFYSFPTRRSSDLAMCIIGYGFDSAFLGGGYFVVRNSWGTDWARLSPFGPGHGTLPFSYVGHYGWEAYTIRSEEHTSELQSRFDLVCRLLLEKKK